MKRTHLDILGNHSIAAIDAITEDVMRAARKLRRLGYVQADRAQQAAAAGRSYGHTPALHPPGQLAHIGPATPGSSSPKPPSPRKPPEPTKPQPTNVAPPHAQIGPSPVRSTSATASTPSPRSGPRTDFHSPPPGPRSSSEHTHDFQAFGRGSNHRVESIPRHGTGGHMIRSTVRKNSLGTYSIHHDRVERVPTPGKVATYQDKLTPLARTTGFSKMPGPQEIASSHREVAKAHGVVHRGEESRGPFIDPNPTMAPRPAKDWITRHAP